MSDNKTLSYGDLVVTLTSAFTPRWNDSGSGANRDGACTFSPVLYIQPPFCPVHVNKPSCSFSRQHFPSQTILSRSIHPYPP